MIALEPVFDAVWGKPVQPPDKFPVVPFVLEVPLWPPGSGIPPSHEQLLALGFLDLLVGDSEKLEVHDHLLQHDVINFS